MAGGRTVFWEWEWAGLGWAGLGRAGLGWAGLGWAGWAGLGWAGLGYNWGNSIQGTYDSTYNLLTKSPAPPSRGTKQWAAWPISKFSAGSSQLFVCKGCGGGSSHAEALTQLEVGV